jgi:Flagellar motor component
MRYVKAGKFKIDILLPVIIIISYFSGYMGQLFMAYAAVLIHEAAHAFVALLYGCFIKNIYFLAFGTRIEPDISVESKIKKCIIFAAGPAVNIIAALLIYFISIDSELKQIAIVSNLCLAAFNILPLQPLDGGEILSIYTTSRYGFFYSEKISQSVFLIIIIFLFIISVPVALFRGNLSMLILSVFLFSNRRKGGDAAFMNAKNLYYRRARLLKKGYFGVREVVILDRMTLGEAFKIMDFDQYHILIILDGNLKIIHRLTESELLTAINDFGYGYTFREFIREVK